MDVVNRKLPWLEVSTPGGLGNCGKQGLFILLMAGGRVQLCRETLHSPSAQAPPSVEETFLLTACIRRSPQDI